MSQIPLFRTALILFVSGFCSLIYQTVWLREFRLIFGSSTTATAAVLAIFMAGLGIGGLILGQRVDRHGRPFELYAKLEAAIALTTALSPFLLDAVRWLYLWVGGSSVLGPVSTLIVRLILALLIMGPPTFLMGGTLPAAARAVTGAGDPHRRKLAILYGLNALGAVVGVLAGTFALFEIFGFRLTLWVVCLINLLLAVLSRASSRRFEKEARATATPLKDPEVVALNSAQAPTSLESPKPTAAMPTWLVLGAAFTTGFTFFLAELIWYRMTGPILGGSTYTMGIVLAVALVGIGLGGLIHYIGGRQEVPTPSRFALTCMMQAVAILVPFALGDRVAMLALTLREYGQISFLGLVFSWTMVVVVLILPAAILSGYQFPLLFSLKGAGAHSIGEDVGKIYLSNTVGAVLGSLVGGFFLIPWLGALGAWILVAVMLCVLGLVVIALERPFKPPSAAWGVALALVVLGCTLAQGPTALWRTTPIGAGRFELAQKTHNDWKAMQRSRTHDAYITYEGVESALAFSRTTALALLVNGKSDGNVYGDRVTQIMLGLVPALLHGQVKKAFVVGLGTGQTAGWLGQLPQIEAVKVAEIEPDVVEFARAAALTNFNVADHKKVEILIGDGRELLLTSKDQYDLVVSEPSNPYRAGLASFYSVDFYQSVSSKLSEGGVFAQWLQSYEIDALAVATVIRTITQVFPHATLWHLGSSDILIVASKQPLTPTVQGLRAQLASEPYREAFERVSQLPGIEGLIAIYAGGKALIELVGEHGLINTDDEPSLEYLFAQSVGKNELGSPLLDIHQINNRNRWTLPDWLPRGESPGALDAPSQEKIRWLRGLRGTVSKGLTQDPHHHTGVRVLSAFAEDRYDLVVKIMEEERAREPAIKDLAIYELIYLFSKISLGQAPPPWTDIEPLTLPLLKQGYTEDVQLLRAYTAVRAGKQDEAVAQLEVLYGMMRQSPWLLEHLVRPFWMAISSVPWTEGQRLRLAKNLTSSPFAVRVLDVFRQRFAEKLIFQASTMPPMCTALIDHYTDESFPWDKSMLGFRYACLKVHGKDPVALEKAREELREFSQAEGRSLADLVGERATLLSRPLSDEKAADPASPPKADGEEPP